MRARVPVGKLLAAVVALALLPFGCASRWEGRPFPPARFDAVIVPGCPSEDDGALSLCQMSRAAWAAILWQRGVAGAFIVSGAAVHSRYVEAEALAAGMATLGVPADRIYVEPNALHTDENMFYSLQIARSLGFTRLAVASQKGHAAWGCQLLVDWGQPCRALSVDMTAVKALDPLPRLKRVRTRAAADYVPIEARERALAALRGRRRPPSYLLYPYIGYLRINGERWVPSPPRSPAPTLTWAALQAGH
ncbi:MAG TPA: YdcF family protein [Polyangia bacterium]|nr:YdcF family protein [Polyangia bacterium]